jgi:hypothetical protein
MGSGVGNVRKHYDDGLIGAAAFLQIGADGVEIVDGALDAARDHHGAGLAADLVEADDLFVEVVDHPANYSSHSVNRSTE